MGENIQAIVAKAFKHQSNDAYNRRFMVPDLFSRIPFDRYHAYRARAVNGCLLQPGEKIVVIMINHQLEVWCESQVVGIIEGDDAAELAALLAPKERAERWLMASIEEECGLDKNFVFKLAGGPPVEAVPTS